MIEILPGILEKDWGAIEEKLRFVETHVAWAHIDIADNTLVPNTTFLDITKFAEYAESVSLEAHLMVANPEKYIKTVADAGFKRIIAHVESHDPRLFLEKVTYEQLEVGIAIDGPTNIEEVEPFLEEVDFVEVMMVEAGFSGGVFLPECIEKIKSIHQNFPDLPIEATGGISDKTAKLVIEAGATRLVSTSYIFKDPANISGTIERLKSLVSNS